MSPLLTIFNFFLIMIGGFSAGLLGSLTGLGGGTVLVPLLTIFYGVPIIYATGASLVSTIATSAGSASAYVKERISNVKIGIGLEVATTAGAIIGSLLAVFVYTHNLEWIIYVLFGAVLLFSLYPTAEKGRHEIPPLKKPDWTTRLFQMTGIYYDARLKKDVQYNGVKWWAGEIVMLFAGIISGLLGIGSGAMKVLGMDWAMNLPMKVTTTTSNFMVGITAATGSSIYWYAGYIQVFIAAATAIGVLAGSFVGTKILVRMSNKNIRWLFFAVLSFLGVEMLLKGLAANGMLITSAGTRLAVSGVVSVILISGLFLLIRKQEAEDVKL